MNCVAARRRHPEEITQMEKETKAGQAEIEKKIRKFRSSLSISGISVIALGLWAVIKSIFNYAINPVNLDDASKTKATETGIKWFLFSVTFFILAVELALRVYVGLNAFSESRGKVRRPVYIVFSIIIAIFIAYNVLPSIVSMFRTRQFFFTSVASLLLDVASFAVLLEMVTSAIRLRYYLKKLGGDNVTGAGVDSGKEAAQDHGA